MDPIKEHQAKISVIIPVPPEQEDIPALSALKNIDYPEDKIEVILAIGRQPSLQRNHAVDISGGDLLCFFNRDTLPAKDIFKNVAGILDGNIKIAGVGGPDIIPEGNNSLQHIFGYAMGSYFAHWRMRSRYMPIGRQRFSDERELIFSNLAIRKEAYVKAEGLNHKLYPNEENELINRISKMGYSFIYSPDVKIYRDRRKNFGAFAYQFFRYGRGRMRQIFIEGLDSNFIFILPVLFTGYLASLIFVHKPYFFLPLCAYFLCVVISASLFIRYNKKVAYMSVLLFPAYLLMHISYAAGMSCEFLNQVLFQEPQNPKIDGNAVDVKIIKGFSEPWPEIKGKV